MLRSANPRHRRGGRLAALVLVLVAACGKGPEQRADEHRTRGETYLAAGKTREATVEFQAALQAWPQDADAAHGLARALDALAAPAEYRDALERTVRLRPDHPGACVDLGGLRWAEGRHQEALDLARRALASAPGHAGASRLEARSLAALGRAEEARAAWDRALKAGADEEAFVEAASFEAATGGADRADATLRRGLATFPSSWRLLVALADLLSLKGDAGGSGKALEEARGAAGDLPELAVAEARRRIRMGDPEAARAGLAEAESRMSADPERLARLAEERGRLLVELGDLEDARAVLERAREGAPSNGRLAASLAYVHLVAGRVDAARLLLPEARKADPSGRQAALLEAWVYLAAGRSSWAAQVLETLVAKGDLTLEAHFLYARALADEGRLGRARAELEAILARSPEHLFARLDLASVLRRQHDPEGALRQFAKVPPPWSGLPQVQYARARALLEAGRLDEAAALARSFVGRAPGNAGLLVLLGDVERARGNGDAGLLHYERAAELEPKAIEPLFAQVAVLEETGRVGEARRRLERFLAEQGERPDVLNRLAGLHLAQGRPEAALQRVDRSLLLEPNHWGSRFLRARVLLAQGQEVKARLELEEAIKLHPLRPEAYNQLAELQRLGGEADRSEETYRRLLDRVPEEPLTNNNLASLYLEQGKTADALARARVAYAGAPRSPVVLDTLGWALHRSGDPHAARPYLEQAAARLPDHPDVLLHRGLNLLAVGQVREGREILTRVAARDPGGAAGKEAASALGGGGPGR